MGAYARPVAWVDGSPPYRNAANLNTVQDTLGQLVAERVYGGRLAAYGTSRTAGRVPQGANLGPLDSAERYSGKLAGMLAMREVMLASAGSTVAWDEVLDATAGEYGGGWATVLHDDRRRKCLQNQNYGYLPANAMWVYADMVNDIARVNDGIVNGTGTRQNSRTTSILKHASRFFFSYACSACVWRPDDTAVVDGSAPLTYGGTTSTQVAVSYDTQRQRAYQGAVSGPGGYRSMPAGATVTIPLQADYPGSALAPLAVLFGGVNAITAGTVTVSGAGTSGNAKTLDLVGANVADPAHINPLVLRFTGSDIPSGASSIVLTVSGVTGANARFLGAWIESPTPPYGIAFNTAKMNGNLYFTWATDSDYNYQNARQAEVVTEFQRSGQPDHVFLADIDSVLQGVRALDSSRAIYFTDTMHGENYTQAEYALLALQSLHLGPLSISTEMRNKVRRARCPHPDLAAELGISANVACVNPGITITPDLEIRDHSQMHTGAFQPTRIYLYSPGTWRLTMETGWRNQQGNLNLTGTVAKTSGQSTLTGTGTAFTTELAIGQTIRVPGGANEDRLILHIASSTSLTVGGTWANTASGQTALRLSPTGLRGIGFKHTKGDGTSTSKVLAVDKMDAAYNAILELLQSFSTLITVRDLNEYVEFTTLQTAGTSLTDEISAGSTRMLVERIGP